MTDILAQDTASSKRGEPFVVHAAWAPAGHQPEAIDALAAGLEAGHTEQILLGVTGSGKTFTVAQLIQRIQCPALLMAPNKILAAQLYQEMRAFFPNNAVEYFVSHFDYYQPEAYVAASDLYISKDSSINEQIERMRLSATKALFERRDVIVVASVSAIYGLGDPRAYLAMVVWLRTGACVPRDPFLHQLVDLQYVRNDMDFVRGRYRVRGEVMDIFPAEQEHEALRVIWCGDRIETLMMIDPLTGAPLRTLSEIALYPKTHYATPRSQLLQAVEGIREELEIQLAVLRAAGRALEAERLLERTRYDVEMLLELGYVSGIENYSRHLSGRAQGVPPPTLLDYFPEDGIVFLDESHVLMGQISGMYRGDRARKETLVKYGFRLPSALDNRPLRIEEFEALCRRCIYVSATPGAYELARTDRVVEQLVRPTGLLDPHITILPATHQVQNLLGQIALRVAREERVFVTTLTKKMAEDLTQYLTDHGIKVRYMHSDVDTVERVALIRDLRLGAFDVLVGINLLREGLDVPEVSLVAVLDADKEGFLRSARALIQTIGRAARHVSGSVVFYADRITPSMQMAIDETDRRRAIQEAFNRLHGITPTGIVKPVLADDGFLEQSPTGRGKRAAPVAALEVLEALPTKRAERIRYLKALEQEMQETAEALDFESARVLRDRLYHLQKLWKIAG